jgi:phenylalanyl-tRNA synthetase beta chain
LSATGYLECRSPALETPEQVEATASPIGSAVKLKNPMSREYGALRTSLLPGLVRVVDRNARRGAPGSRVYETDKVYRAPGEAEKAKDLGAAETIMIAGVAGGVLNDMDWSNANRVVNFYDVKGVVEDLLELAGVHDASFEHADRAGFTTDTSAAIRRRGATETLGYLGEIDSNAISTGKTPFKLFAFELQLAPLLATYAAATAYKSLARTPAVLRDLAFVLKSGDVYSDIERTLRESAGATLESLRLVDIYQGKPIPAGHRSLALRLVFRDPSRTLTAEEVQTQVDRIVAAMKQKFDAMLRT